MMEWNKWMEEMNELYDDSNCNSILLKHLSIRWDCIWHTLLYAFEFVRLHLKGLWKKPILRLSNLKDFYLSDTHFFIFLLFTNLTIFVYSVMWLRTFEVSLPHNLNRKELNMFILEHVVMLLLLTVTAPHWLAALL